MHRDVYHPGPSRRCGALKANDRSRRSGMLLTAQAGQTGGTTMCFTGDLRGSSVGVQSEAGVVSVIVAVPPVFRSTRVICSGRSIRWKWPHAAEDRRTRVARTVAREIFTGGFLRQGPSCYRSGFHCARCSTPCGAWRFCQLAGSVRRRRRVTPGGNTQGSCPCGRPGRQRCERPG